MKRKQLLCALFILCTLSIGAQESIDLSGPWQFAIDRSADATKPKKGKETVTLPGSMLTNGKGDPVTLDTKWVGSLYDSSY